MLPICVAKNYLLSRRKYKSDEEPFFIFQDGSPVTLVHNRKILLNRLNPRHYGVHGMRAGCSSDLLDIGVLVETIKKLDRWQSMSVYKYLHV